MCTRWFTRACLRHELSGKDYLRNPEKHEERHGKTQPKGKKETMLKIERKERIFVYIISVSSWEKEERERKKVVDG